MNNGIWSRMVAKFLGNVKRDDFRLRTKYPFLTTRIFYTGGYGYFIYVENLNKYPYLKFEDLQQEFDYSIRMMGNPTKLTNSIPENYIEEYKPIEDDKISENFAGVFFTESMFINFLKAKFNTYKIVGFRTDFQNQLFIVGLDYTSEQEKNNLQLELNKLELSFDFTIEKESLLNENTEKNIDFGNPILNTIAKQDNIMQIPAYALQPVKLDYIKRDESLWFDNIDKVYTGEFTKDKLKFFDRNKTSCLIDYTAASNIDIRNVLLMYDTIYLMLPLKEHNDMLFNTSFSRDNLFSLIEKDRLKLISIQPEERLDVEILKEAYNIKPNSVVNRRALSLLSVIDLYEMNKNSIFNDIGIQEVFYDIAKIISKELNVDISDIIDFIAWPKKALRDSFETFNRNGIWAYGQLGVNELLKKPLNKISGKDLTLELTMTSQNIHLANALNATLFPSFLYNEKGKRQSFEAPYANMMGNFLNFYKYATREKLQSYTNIENFKFNKNQLISPIDIFEINTYIPFEEFEAYTSSSTTRNSVNVLFNKLSNLSLEERSEEIKKYNEYVAEFQKKNKLKLILSDISNDILGLTIPTILTGNILPLIIFSMFNSNLFKGILSRTDLYKKIQSEVESLNNYINVQAGKLSDIDILSQINRVAKLK